MRRISQCSRVAGAGSDSGRDGDRQGSDRARDSSGEWSQQWSLHRVNCGAIPPELIDSQLFGHEKGSFTGSPRNSPRLVRTCRGGTLLLDEIGELPPNAQVRFLRVLQDGFVERIGSHRPIQVDVRVVQRRLTETWRRWWQTGHFEKTSGIASPCFPSLSHRSENGWRTFRRSLNTSLRRLRLASACHPCIRRSKTFSCCHRTTGRATFENWSRN